MPLVGGGVTMAERKIRVNTVLDMIIAGKSTKTVIDFAMKTWGVSLQTAYKYINTGDKLLGETLKKDRAKKVNYAVAQREFLIEKLIEDGSYAAAIQGLADRDKLQGLYTQDDSPDATVVIEII